MQKRSLITAYAWKLMGNRKAHLERETGYIYYHGIRVANICEQIRRSLGNTVSWTLCEDALYTAALFHDIGKAIEPHNETGALLAGKLLKDYVDKCELSEIQSIIRLHNQRTGDPAHSPETLLVQDADLLDHFGTQEIWMNFYYAASHESSCQSSIEYWKSEEFSQWYTKCMQNMNFEICRKELSVRHDFFRSFKERFAAEAAGEISVIERNRSHS